MRGKICNEIDHKILVLNYLRRRGLEESAEKEEKQKNG